MSNDLKQRLLQGITLYSACLENADKHMSLLNEAADNIDEFEAKVIAQQARIAELETTPPDKREDLRCVISDLCHQVRERDARIVAQQARIEQLKALIPTRLPDGFVALGRFYCETEDKFNDPHNQMCKFKRTYLDNCVYALSTPDDLSALRAHDVALENCRLFAARNRNEEWAKTILRFCDEAGIIGSPLRAGAIEKGSVR